MNRISRSLLAGAVFIAALVAGTTVLPAQTPARADCCSIPSGESVRPVPSSPAPTYGIPTSESLRPCMPRLARPCP
jgi:hypothetical protein